LDVRLTRPAPPLAKPSCESHEDRLLHELVHAPSSSLAACSRASLASSRIRARFCSTQRLTSLRIVGSAKTNSSGDSGSLLRTSDRPRAGWEDLSSLSYTGKSEGSFFPGGAP